MKIKNSANLKYAFAVCIISRMSDKNQSEDEQKLHTEVVRQMLTLATSGFALVAALAWNSLIQEFVNQYVRKWLPGNGGIISLLIYAVVITIFAVLVTLQLSRFLKRLEIREK